MLLIFNKFLTHFVIVCVHTCTCRWGSVLPHSVGEWGVTVTVSLRVDRGHRWRSLSSGQTRRLSLATVRAPSFGFDWIPTQDTNQRYSDKQILRCLNVFPKLLSTVSKMVCRSVLIGSWTRGKTMPMQLIDSRDYAYFILDMKWTKQYFGTNSPVSG